MIPQPGRKLHYQCLFFILFNLTFKLACHLLLNLLGCLSLLIKQISTILNNNCCFLFSFVNSILVSLFYPVYLTLSIFQVFSLFLSHHFFPINYRSIFISMYYKSLFLLFFLFFLVFRGLFLLGMS